MIDYFSLILVLSFMFFHNIFMLLSGLVIAFLSINKHRLTNLNIKSSDGKKLVKRDNLSKEEISLKVEQDDTYHISLVEIVEESGFIPSEDTNNDNLAA